MSPFVDLTSEEIESLPQCVSNLTLKPFDSEPEIDPKVPEVRISKPKIEQNTMEDVDRKEANIEISRSCPSITATLVHENSDSNKLPTHAPPPTHQIGRFELVSQTPEVELVQSKTETQVWGESGQTEWGWSVVAGGRFWPTLATRGPYKDQFIYSIIGTNCTCSVIYMLVLVETFEQG